MKTITLTVNGETVTAAVEPRTHLGDFLRSHLQLTGTHLGCEHGVCGACTVLIDGAPARSCINYAVACDGVEVRTVEGFGDDLVMNRLRQAFTDRHALQCGFCTPGQLISARDLLVRLENADEARIRKEMSANLCRCTGYMGIVEAVLEVFADRDPALLEARRNAATTPSLTEGAAPVVTPAEASAPSVPTATLAGCAESDEGWTEIGQTLSFDHPADEVWARLNNYELVANCLPGAAIDTLDGDRIAGRFRVALGPITAEFHGKAEIERDDAARSGRLRGQGDEKSGATRARGELTYRVSKAGSGCTVDLSIRYQIQGRLAQFTRGGIVVDFVGRLAGEFARNLAAAISGEGPAPAGQPLRAGGMFLSVLWARIKRFFGGR
jgi:carbon-monoxide dehydrogenase small subunit